VIGSSPLRTIEDDPGIQQESTWEIIDKTEGNEIGSQVSKEDMQSIRGYFASKISQDKVSADTLHVSGNSKNGVFMEIGSKIHKSQTI